MRHTVYLIGSEICILDSINDRCVASGIITQLIGLNAFSCLDDQEYTLLFAHTITVITIPFKNELMLMLIFF